MEPISRKQILETIPYGDSFLFVDAIEGYSEKSIEARFHISDSLAWTSGHFKDLKIAPGLILVEGLMQALSYLGTIHLKDRSDRYFVLKEFSSIRFLRPIFLPADVVYSAEITDWNERDVFFLGRIKVSGQVAIEAAGTVYCIKGERINALRSKE